MDQPSSGAPGSGCLLRAIWMFGGPALLLILAIPLARHSREGYLVDLAFLGVLGASAAARLLDRSEATPPSSSPGAAQPPAKRPYLIGLGIGAVALWALARWLGPEIFP